MNKAEVVAQVSRRSGMKEEECVKVLEALEVTLSEELSCKGWKKNTLGIVYRILTAMKRRLVVLSLCLVWAMSVHAQDNNRLSQVIRGVVTDAASGLPIPNANIWLVDLPEIGTVSDKDGVFQLKDVPVGRHTIQTTFVGYDPMVLREIAVSSSKEVVLEIPLKENIRELNEVVVRARVNKEQPLNKMATTGARMLSVEEANRYAGGFNDPARLASSFAGVSSDGMTNGISIHGNAPHLLQWRLEGVEIPNPNHFADISILGGGILSSLSSQVLGNSDFFTGAFPAEYNNAVSGVFDVRLRNGNNQKHEHTLQAGTLGIDVASEGPLSRKHRSSYLINYRYSAIGLAKKLGMMNDMEGQALDYQDLNFKFNIPTSKSGTFSVWATGLIDHFKSSEQDSTKWKCLFDQNKSASTQYMLAAGVGHHYLFANGGQLKTTWATTYFKEHASSDYYDTQLQLIPDLDMYRRFTNLIFSTSYTRKVSARFTNKTGLSYTQMFYDMRMNKSPFVAQPLVPVYAGDGNTGLLSVYTGNSIGLSEQITLNIGLNAQWLTLNNQWTLEPRAGVQWRASARSTFAAAYGLHSRMEKTDVYFVRTEAMGDELVNKELDFTKTHHFLLSYAIRLTDNVNLKIESYYQYLFDVPVTENGSYSVLNRRDFYVEEALINKGKGRNYGVDITLERYLERGIYYMFTGSVFNSRYCGGDGVWHDTRYNRRYILNLLGGKEWMVGKRQQNVLGVNLKFTLQGGDRYSPIDEAATMAHPDHEVQYDENQAFAKQFSPMFVGNYTISYKINRKKVSHEFAVKHLNATGKEGYVEHIYNYKIGKIEPFNTTLSLPNISYKLEF